MLKINKKKSEEKTTMKNDILLFMVVFAVAWIGFTLLKDRLPPSVSDSASPALSTESIAQTNSGSTSKASVSSKSGNYRPQDNPSDKQASPSPVESQTNSVSTEDRPLTPSKKIEQVLIRQTKDWNRGDLDAFMDAYWNDENLTFSGGGDTTLGWEDTYASYRQRYPEGKMGQIEFKNLKTEMVGKESAIVTGRFDHQLIGETVRGNFSLVLKLIDGQWKIIHDHTSVAK